MDKKAIYNLTYGVFMLATKAGDKINGCITNTGIQVANNPYRIGISVINKNYTCELIKESGIFTMSILDNRCNFEMIQHFGMQSGRDVDKFEGMDLPKDDRGVPYLAWGANAVISCRVVDSIDLGSHTFFVGEVEDAKVLSDAQPMTYAYYQSTVKPKPAEKPKDRKIVGWRCTICNYVYEGAELPKDYSCPLCSHGPDDFEPIYE